MAVKKRQGFWLVDAINMKGGFKDAPDGLSLTAAYPDWASLIQYISIGLQLTA